MKIIRAKFKDDGRIDAYGDRLVGGQEIEVPDEIALSEIGKYRYENDVWIYDPLPEEEPEPTLNDVMEALLGVSEDE